MILFVDFLKCWEHKSDKRVTKRSNADLMNEEIPVSHVILQRRTESRKALLIHWSGQWNPTIPESWHYPGNAWHSGRRSSSGSRPFDCPTSLTKYETCTAECVRVEREMQRFRRCSCSALPDGKTEYRRGWFVMVFGTEWSAICCGRLIQK